MNAAQLHQRVNLKNILFPTDFSPAAKWALPFVRKIAQEFDADVTTVHVAVPDLLTYMTPDSPKAAIELQQEWALGEIKKVEMQLPGIRNHVAVRTDALWKLLAGPRVPQAVAAFTGTIGNFWPYNIFKFLMISSDGSSEFPAHLFNPP